MAAELLHKSHWDALFTLIFKIKLFGNHLARGFSKSCLKIQEMLLLGKDPKDKAYEFVFIGVSLKEAMAVGKFC